MSMLLHSIVLVNISILRSKDILAGKAYGLEKHITTQYKEPSLQILPSIMSYQSHE